MLAYLLWHRPKDPGERDAYEHALLRLHASLADAPPSGFLGSGVFRAHALPWFAGADAYEDWYLVEDFAALGLLNEAAVAHRHKSAHDAVAHAYGAAAGGLYGLREGHPKLNSCNDAVWVSRPPRTAPPELDALLGDGMDPARSSLWRRSLVLGPAPEYCLLAPEPPPGLAKGRLPAGWHAITCHREPIWPA
jgi:hypothetical protein